MIQEIRVFLSSWLFYLSDIIYPNTREVYYKCVQEFIKEESNEHKF
jgi:hypothetical protein